MPLIRDLFRELVLTEDKFCGVIAGALQPYAAAIADLPPLFLQVRFAGGRVSVKRDPPPVKVEAETKPHQT